MVTNANNIYRDRYNADRALYIGMCNSAMTVPFVKSTKQNSSCNASDASDTDSR